MTREENSPKQLRVIKTARTAESINEAARSGFWPLIKKVEPGKKITSMFAIFQNTKTGEIDVAGDCRWHPPEPFKKAIDFTLYYPYSFPKPFAAYLISQDLHVEEHVWLEDIIEDIVAIWGNQGHHPRLESGEAKWDGKEFKILFNPAKDAPRWIG